MDIKLLQKYISESKSFREVAKKFGTQNHSQLKRLAIESNIDFSHFIHKNAYKQLTIVNMLTIVKTFPKNGREIALCECKCGKLKEVRCDALKSGRYISCGCHTKNRPEMCGSNNPAFRGLGCINASFLTDLKYKATRRGLECTITLQDLWDKFKDQDGKCIFTGLQLYFGRRCYPNETNASVDRIDCDFGYVPGNIRWVIKDINMIRKDYDTEYFISLCNLVAKNHPRDL